MATKYLSHAGRVENEMGVLHCARRKLSNKGGQRTVTYTVRQYAQRVPLSLLIDMVTDSYLILGSHGRTSKLGA